MFCYETETIMPRSGGSIPELDPTFMYLKHYGNYLYLSFILNNSKDRLERLQAKKELDICERKLDYWKKKYNYNHDAALKGVQELKKKWKV